MSSFTSEELVQLVEEFKLRAVRLENATSGFGSIDWTLGISGGGRTAGQWRVKYSRGQPIIMVIVLSASFGDATLEKIANLAKEHLFNGKTPVSETKESHEGFILLSLVVQPAAPDERRNPQIDWSLIFAAEHGDLETVRSQLAAGAAVNSKNLAGLTSLFFAVAGGHLEVARFLIQHGADPNIKTNNGLAPLFMAAHRGNKDMVELVLEAGADINARNTDGTTALSVAVEKGHQEVAEILRKAGARA